MTTLDELCAAISSLGIPWANERFSDGLEPEPPFVLLVAGYDEPGYADGSAWYRPTSYDVALYTRTRDYTTESKIGTALDAIGCPWERMVTHLDSEGLIETAFSVYVTEEQNNG